MVLCEFSKLKADVEEEYKSAGRVAVSTSLLEKVEKQSCCGKIFFLDWAFEFAKKLNCKNVTFEMDEDNKISYIWFIDNFDYQN